MNMRKRFVKNFVWFYKDQKLGLINQAEEKYFKSLVILCWRRLLRVSWTKFRTDDIVLNEIDEPRE